jgi:cyclopropane-fatty-acyl-phospholipid synthase
MLCKSTFETLIQVGSLCVTDAYGNAHQFGMKGSQPSAAIRLHSPRLHWQLYTHPDLAIGEAWMDGTLTITGGTLRDLLALFTLNRMIVPSASAHAKAQNGFGFFARALQRFVSMVLPEKNTIPHYTLGNAFYSLFLDKEMYNSCAYFTVENETLEDAQLNKKRHIAAKLALQPGIRVLDIDCGCGGLALYLAREAGVHVTGLVRTEDQLVKARMKALEAGLDRQVEFYLRDYRDQEGQFDRIVSVGMLEYLGQPHYNGFFAKVMSLLKPDGVALVESIGRMEMPQPGNAWLQKYIHPNAYSPALSEVLPAVEQQGMWLSDMEILRLHYALTAEQWLRRFEANRERIIQMYDARFCRMWEFYLTGMEMEFRYGNAMVFQMQLTRISRTLPITRDYMIERERAMIHVQKLPPARRYAIH